MIRPPEITLRLLAAGELDAWLALLNAASHDCPGFEPQVRLDYTRRQVRGDVDPASPLVALHGSELIGGVSFAAGRQSKRGRLSDLVVSPDCRRRGIGQALVAAALAELRARGVTIVQAQDWSTTAYDRLYRGLGFRPARRYQRFAWDLRGAAPELESDAAIQVRPATPADVDGVAAVFARADLPDWYWSRPFEDLEDLRHPALWASAASTGTGPHQICWVAVEGDAVAGASVTRVDPALNQSAGRRDGSFDRGGVAVLPAYPLRPLGQRLVQAGLDYFRGQGLARALVWAYAPLEGETPLIRLYRESGAQELVCHMAWEIEWAE
jgi:ribosomal protein S18 acetylase RimI-like enzyme